MFNNSVGEFSGHGIICESRERDLTGKCVSTDWWYEERIGKQEKKKAMFSGDSWPYVSLIIHLLTNSL